MNMTFKDPRVLLTARSVQALARDLRSLEQRIPPTIEQRMEAPIIEQWMVTYRLEPALVGMVSGHPIRADGRAVTSGLYYLDTEQKFARTLSRYYRLGRPKEVQANFHKEGEL